MTSLRILALPLTLAAGLSLAPARPVPASPPQIRAVPYDTLEARLGGRITFDTLPRRAEPGFLFDAPLRIGRAWIGEHFAGQILTKRRDRNGIGFDGPPETPPRPPLTIRPGPPGASLSVAYHRGFGSNALFPLGPEGFPALQSRGEGAVAVLFDQAQSAVGLRVHTAYPDPLGAVSSGRGGLELFFYTRQGTLLAHLHLRLDQGLNELGFQRAGNRRDIAGVLILNTDPGGVAIDDILHDIALLLG